MFACHMCNKCRILNMSDYERTKTVRKPVTQLECSVCGVKFDRWHVYLSADMQMARAIANGWSVGSRSATCPNCRPARPFVAKVKTVLT